LLRVGAQNEKVRGKGGPEKAMFVVRGNNIRRQKLRRFHPRAPGAWCEAPPTWHVGPLGDDENDVSVVLAYFCPRCGGPCESR
jgi:hypothetical protein